MSARKDWLLWEDILHQTVRCFTWNWLSLVFGKMSLLLITSMIGKFTIAFLSSIAEIVDEIMRI